MIRELKPRDVPAWAGLRARLWPNEDRDELLREAHAFVSDGDAGFLDAVFIAESTEDGSEPIGFLELSVRAFSDGCDSRPVPHIEGWYVADALRGRGVGRALMRAAETWCTARGYTELASDTEVHNEASQVAHAKCGFEEVDRLVKFRKKLE
jgi:aminoglycoside 6'-N-acetyltransferase I